MVWELPARLAASDRAADCRAASHSFLPLDAFYSCTRSITLARLCSYRQ